MEEQCRDRHNQTGRRGDQRRGDAAGQHRGIGHAAAHEAAEDLDHADHGAQQTEQRRDGGNGAERVEVAFQVMDDPRSGFLDALFHDVAAVLGVGQTGGEHLAQRRGSAQLLELLAVQLFVLNPAPDLAQQVGRSDPRRTQGPQALGTDGERGD
ncbi:hypothetical protein D3C81_1740040 [compost metagenome]